MLKPSLQLWKGHSAIPVCVHLYEHIPQLHYLGLGELGHKHVRRSLLHCVHLAEGLEVLDVACGQRQRGVVLVLAINGQPLVLQSVHGRGARLGLLGQQVVHQVLCTDGDRTPVSTECGDFPSLDELHELIITPHIAPGKAAAEHEVNDDAQAPDISLEVVPAARRGLLLENFWRNVQERTAERVRLLSKRHTLCKAKVNELESAVLDGSLLCQEEVLWFEVPVHDPVLMQVIDR
mmetsp:Transcript_50697/g.117711  ORF Transcript_50697/g.117711 Transcript_50697/m.117711 type:complete len:235 (+) Transcript_50697:520-1224(+)